MIHTSEINRMIPAEDVNRILVLYFLEDGLKIPYEAAFRKLMGRLILDEKERHTGTYLDDCNRKIPLNEYDCATKTLTLDPCVIGLGFNSVKLIRICQIKARKKKNGIEYGVVNCLFYIRLEINPRTLYDPLDTITVDLYEATPENNSWLQLMFNSIMKSTFCKYDNSLEYLCHLESWNCSRIDYTCNMKFNTAEEKDLFWKLTHKTSIYNRTTKKRIKGIKMMDQSAAEGNKSYKTLFYDKQDECEHTYQNISQETKSRLLLETENVIRFEHQVHKNGINTLMNRYKLPDRSIIHFLSEDISRRELLDRYDKMIGKGDFYHREEAKRIIRKNIIGEKNKEKLIQLLELLAQKRHVDKARAYFVNPSPPNQIREFPLAHGNVKTFRERITSLRELGINPMLITDGCPVRFMKNPRYMLM